MKTTKFYFIIAVLFLMSHVVAMAEATLVYVKVTDASILNDGDEIIIANSKHKMALGNANSSTSSKGYWAAVPVDIEDDILLPNDKVRRFYLVVDKAKNGTKFYLKTDEGKYYKATDKGFLIDDTSKKDKDWAITCCEDSSYIYFNKTKQKLNLNDGLDLFSCYADYARHNSVSIFRKTDTVAEKQQTKISFSTDGVTSYVVKKGKETIFVAPKAVVRDADGNVIEAEVVYSSDAPEIVSIDTNSGDVSFNSNGKFGQAVITASFLGNTSYEASSASYSIDYKDMLKAQVSFGSDNDGKTITVYQGKENDFVSPKASLNPQDIGELSYSSDDESVVKVDNTGEISFVSLGEAVIKATFLGNEDYYSASACYTIHYIPQSILFSSESKSFAKVPEKESGNEKKVDFLSTDGQSYSFLVTNAKLSNSKLYISAHGTVSLSQPLGYANGYKVIVNYVQSNASKTELLSIRYKDGKNLSDQVYATLVNGATDAFVASLDVPGDFLFIIKAGYNQAKVSSIEIVPNIVPELLLDEASDNLKNIQDILGKVANVSLKRTLVADKWNTFCVPFDLNDLPQRYNGLEIKEYDAEKGIVGNTMFFKNVDKIVAGYPYLVKPHENIENPVFNNVMIKTCVTQSVGSDDYKFVGVFSPLVFDDEMSRKSLFLSGDGTLLYPDSGTRMRGMRAYFSFPGEMHSNVAEISFDEIDTMISDAVECNAFMSGRIFNLNGSYVGNKVNALEKGVYIRNGKKIIVK